MPFDFTSFHSDARKAMDHIKNDIGQLRTGRASSQLLDTVGVEAYGTRMKITEVANISVPDSNMLIVTPWDKGLLSAIEKGINAAGLNLNPVVDGQQIRIVVPSLTEERRKEMVKLLSQKLESGRVLLRSVRTDAKKSIDDQKGQPGISEDNISADLVQLDLQLKKYLEELDEMGKHKEQELMTI